MAFHIRKIATGATKQSGCMFLKSTAAQVFTIDFCNKVKIFYENFSMMVSRDFIGKRGCEFRLMG